MEFKQASVFKTTRNIMFKVTLYFILFVEWEIWLKPVSHY